MVAWMFLPWWVFVPIALYLYFVPLSQTQTAIGPFLALLALCLMQPAGYCFAVVFGVLFWYVLLIKDLYIIERKSAYEILSLIIVFLSLRLFYLDMGGRMGIDAIVWAFAIAGLFAGLVSGFIGNFSPNTAADGTGTASSAQNPLRRVAVFAAFLLFFQILIVGLFLPLDFIYQSVVAFLLTALVIEFFPQYLFGSLSRTKFLATASVLFTLLVVVLGSARWGL